MEAPQKIKNRTTFDLGISLLGIYPKETKILTGKDICAPMSIAALFAVDQDRK